MGYIKKIFLVPVLATFVLILATVFLHPAYSQPVDEVDEVVILLCHCGKPVYGIVATNKKFQMSRIKGDEILIEACKSYRSSMMLPMQKGEILVNIRYVEESKDQCPLNI